MNQSDLLVNSSDKEILKKVESKIQTEKTIPSEYLEIKLNSLGKLSAPVSLHFRDYTLDDLIELNNHLNDEKYLESLIKVLNSMIFEKEFDCSFLTEEEIIEILLSIHLRWHGTLIQNIPYYIDEDIKDKELKNAKSNIDYATVDIKKINTITLSEEFKEPFRPEILDNEYYFMLPRIGNGIFAKKYIEEKYLVLDKKFSDLKALILENQKIKNPLERFKIDEKQLKEYENYIEAKMYDMIRITTALNIYGKLENGEIKKFSIEEKIEAYPKVKPQVWKQYTNIKDKYGKFGIDNKVKFFSFEKKEEITRRLAFQYFHFLPDMELQDDNAINVSFGIEPKKK